MSSEDQYQNDYPPKIMDSIGSQEVKHMTNHKTQKIMRNMKQNYLFTGYVRLSVDMHKLFIPDDVIICIFIHWYNKPRSFRNSIKKPKQPLTDFLTTYSISENWLEGGQEKDVKKYILCFIDGEPLHVRMNFLYSMTLYLGQIVGVNKRCISHAFMLLKPARYQIDTLSKEFALILQTLQLHNDDKLWKYVYSFLYNISRYYKHIKQFIGSSTSVNNAVKHPTKSKKYLLKKKRDEQEQIKHGLINFFTKYSNVTNWEEFGKENNVQKYKLCFQKMQLKARMAFLYSITVYLGQIVGINKRCSSHTLMLFKSVRTQIDVLTEEFALILQTLEYHDNDRLWKYVYTCLHNVGAYFKHIEKFIGTRTSVDK